MQISETFNGLIEEANQHNLYKKLIEQLNKDFLLANIEEDFDINISPTHLKQMLHETIFGLIQNKFSDYLNLLYIIDVSEKQIKQLDGEDTLLLSEQVSFLILKREWQKVWYRYKY